MDIKQKLPLACQDSRRFVLKQQLGVQILFVSFLITVLSETPVQVISSGSNSSLCSALFICISTGEYSKLLCAVYFHK